MQKTIPFLFGAQYYRAPTPEPECWAQDFARMRALGFNAVKLWVQWRWSHRQPDQFVFDDLDQLMDLAQRHELKVTLNTILDVAPVWLYEFYPDARQVSNAGLITEPFAVGHRQIGGHPGPCYNHPGALMQRKRFMEATVRHFGAHPALEMWDIWNEPELSFPQRHPDIRTLVCYCAHCQQGFISWLQRKYQELDPLNQVWGRCYTAWEQVEMPRTTSTINDFVDWREFHLDTMTGEGRWRIALTKALDPKHICYLHVVPNVMREFSSVTCADDFELAQTCDVFAATMNGGPILAPQVLSAGQGKVCYNVESHINHGCTNLHQRRLDLPDLLRDFLPQIGLGIKGFLFWQYRAEVLGFESPAWGLVQPDGGDRPITKAVEAFWRKISPRQDQLLCAQPPQPAIGIWKSRKNELFHFCIQQRLDALAESVEAYMDLLYWHNHPFRIISGQMLEQNQLEGIKLLVMPCCYYLTELEAQALDHWVHAGGVLVCEAHLAGYNATAGRHSRIVPGCGLAQSFGIREQDSTSSYHLRLPQRQAFTGQVTDDVRKALEAFGTTGGKYFPITLASGNLAWGAESYAFLEGENLILEGWFDPDNPCMVSKAVGQGKVFYCGTNLGLGCAQGNAGLLELLTKALNAAELQPVAGCVSSSPGKVHVDLLADDSQSVFLVVVNRSTEAQNIRLQLDGEWKGLFSGQRWEGGDTWTIEGEFVDLLRSE